MAKVILIAMFSLLVALPAGGEPFPMAAPVDEWTRPAEWKLAVLLDSLATPLPSLPAFGSLVLFNRLDEVAWTDHPGIPEAHWIVRPSEVLLRAAAPGAAVLGDWRGDRIAALSSSSNELSRPQRSQGRIGRERKLWPQRRPLRGAQAWLARKQP